MSGKQSGLGARFVLGGYDLSGDVSALDTISGGPALGDVTGIDKYAHERIGLLRDGAMSFTSFWNDENSVPVLDSLPRTDVQAAFFLPPQAVGSAAALLNAKQVNYDPARGNSGELTMKTECQGNAYGLEWCQLLTAGLRTDATPTSGASLDGGAAFTTPAVPASTVAVTNTSPLPATVVVTGGTVSAVTVNGAGAGTGDGTYVVPAGQAVKLTYSVAPTWTWALQTAFGAQAYLQVTAFTGTSVTVAVQDSADNATWAAVTGLAFTAVTAAPAGQRLATLSTAALRRYVRVVTTGTFTAATFAVAVNRNLVAVSF